jgi:non-heme chloroperoxidase
MPTMAAADGTQLFYRDEGTGPAVLLVHAWSLNSGMWEYQVSALLEAGYRCVMLDRRGHGRSDVAGTGYDLDTLAADLARLLEQLDLHDVSVVAHSMGVCEAVRLATGKGLGRISRAVFVAGMTPYVEGMAGPELLTSIVSELRRDRPAWFHSGADGYFARPGSGVSDALVSDTLVQILQPPLQVQTACLTSAVSTDLTAALQTLSIPVLVVHGDADASAPLALTGEPTAKLLPNAELRVYAGAPHGLYVTERERLNADVLAFLEPA